MTLRRLASTCSALVVAAIAALASYSHMRWLAMHYGQTPLIAGLLPVSVDGMMVVATVALGDGRRYRWSAWLAFWMGVVASIVANVLAAEPSVIARCISAWPSIAFVLVIEVITRGGRRRSVASEPAFQVEAGTPAEPSLVDAPGADLAPVADSQPEQPKRRVQPMTTKQRVQRYAKRQPDATAPDIARALGVSEKTVRTYLQQPPSASAETPINGHEVPAMTPQ